MNFTKDYPNLNPDGVTLINLDKDNSIAQKSGFAPGFYMMTRKNRARRRGTTNKPRQPTVSLYYYGEFFFYKPFSYFINPELQPFYSYLGDLTINDQLRELKILNQCTSTFNDDLVNKKDFKTSILKLMPNRDDFAIEEIKKLPLKNNFNFIYRVTILDKDKFATEVNVNIGYSGCKTGLKNSLNKDLDLNNNFVY